METLIRPSLRVQPCERRAMHNRDTLGSGMSVKTRKRGTKSAFSKSRNRTTIAFQFSVDLNWKQCAVSNLNVELHIVYILRVRIVTEKIFLLCLHIQAHVHRSGASVQATLPPRGFCLLHTISFPLSSPRFLRYNKHHSTLISTRKSASGRKHTHALILDHIQN
jgi:hypothetical protein